MIVKTQNNCFVNLANFDRLSLWDHQALNRAANCAVVADKFTGDPEDFSEVNIILADLESQEEAQKLLTAMGKDWAMGKPYFEVKECT